MYGTQSLSAKQAELHRQRHLHSKRKRIFFTIIFFLLTVGFFYLIRQPYLRIEAVSVSGSTLVSTEEVKKTVEVNLLGYKYFLIPRNSIVFVKKENIKKIILEKYPRLSNVVISGRRNLDITIYEPDYSSMYCNLAGEVLVPEDCALLRPDGRLGSTAPDYSYPPFFTFYKKSDILPELGSEVLNTVDLDRVKLLETEVESYNIPVVGFSYGDEYEEILLDTGSSFSELPRIRILPGAGAGDISKTLGTAVKDPVIQKILIEDLTILDYIDLRFNGQVVYKKRGEE